MVFYGFSLLSPLYNLKHKKTPLFFEQCLFLVSLGHYQWHYSRQREQRHELPDNRDSMASVPNIAYAISFAWTCGRKQKTLETQNLTRNYKRITDLLMKRTVQLQRRFNNNFDAFRCSCDCESSPSMIYGKSPARSTKIVAHLARFKPTESISDNSYRNSSQEHQHCYATSLSALVLLLLSLVVFPFI